MRSTLAVVVLGVATSCVSNLPTECNGSEGCHEAADAAIDFLLGEKGEMPAYLRADQTGERRWFVVACWPEGRYITINVTLDGTPRATAGGGLYGVQPCA